MAYAAIIGLFMILFIEITLGIFPGELLCALDFPFVHLLFQFGKFGS